MKKIILLISLTVLIAGCKKTDDTSNGNGNTSTPLYIDVHCHLHGTLGGNQFDFESPAAIAVDKMDSLGIKSILVMPPPFSNQESQNGIRYDIDKMSSVLDKYPGRFYFLGGGKELNVMIQQAVTGEANISVSAFKTKAREVAEMSGCVGFGEMTTLHFCLGDSHVFIQADPDHELFLALVDVAAEYGIPIDIHQEAVPTDMNFPTLVTGDYAANPDTLQANIPNFKTLLSYAKGKGVNIVWCHVGWDNTKMWTTTLCDELLGQYSNLYFSIKTCFSDTPDDNRIVTSSGSIKSEWNTLFQKYPNRFMIGADQFFAAGTSPGPPSMDDTWNIINQLSSDLKPKFGYQTAQTIFNLN